MIWRIQMGEFLCMIGSLCNESNDHENLPDRGFALWSKIWWYICWQIKQTVGQAVDWPVKLNTPQSTERYRKLTKATVCWPCWHMHYLPRINLLVPGRCIKKFDIRTRGSVTDEHIFWDYSPFTEHIWWWVIFGSDDGLVPSDNRTFHEPVLT